MAVAEPNVAGPAAPATADTAKLRHAIDAAVHIGPARSRRQDVAIGIYQIIDIAVLAIHNFDYNTAVQSTNELSILLCKLAPLPLGAEAYQDTAGTTRVVIPARGFNDYLDIACGQIMRRGSREPVELLALLRMLRDVGTLVRADDRKAAVAAKVRDVLSTARESITDSSELARLESMAESRCPAWRLRRRAPHTGRRAEDARPAVMSAGVDRAVRRIAGGHRSAFR